MISVEFFIAAAGGSITIVSVTIPAVVPEAYLPGVYLLPKHLDEEVARLHLPSLGVELSTLTQAQADYLGVPVAGPFKSEHYRY